MGGTGTPSVKEIDIALRHGHVRDAEHLLADSKLHPMSPEYMLREALLSLARGDLGYAELCMQDARSHGRSLPPTDEARYLRNVFRLHLRKHEYPAASAALDQLAEHGVDGWLISMRGLVEYRRALYGSLRRTLYVDRLEAACRHFEEAERYWMEHPSDHKQCPINNRWRWFKAEWRLSKALHMPTSLHIKQMDWLRWDVIDNDSSGLRTLVARAPGLLFWLAERA